MLQRLQFSSRHDSSKSIERPLSAALIDALDTFAGAETRYIGDTDAAAAAAAALRSVRPQTRERHVQNISRQCATFMTVGHQQPLLCSSLLGHVYGTQSASTRLSIAERPARRDTSRPSRRTKSCTRLMTFRETQGHRNC